MRNSMQIIILCQIAKAIEQYSQHFVSTTNHIWQAFWMEAEEETDNISSPNSLMVHLRLTDPAQNVEAFRFYGYNHIFDSVTQNYRWSYQW